MSDDLIKKLEERRMRAVAASREICERAANGVDLSGEDEAAWQRANKDYDTVTAMIAQERKSRESDKRAEEYANEQAEAMRKSGFRERGDSPEEVRTWRDDAREAIKSRSVTKGGRDESLPDLNQFKGTTRRSLAHRVETRAPLVVGTATRGPETVPVTLVESLFEKLFDDSTVLQAGVTMLRTTSGEKLKFPRLASLGALTVANSRVAELGTIQKSEPTFDQVELDAYKYGQISQTSRELIDDSVFNVESLMGQVLGRNMANYLGQDLTSGDGVSKPRGILDICGDTTANVVTSGTGVGGAIANLDQILDIIWKLKPAYRRRAKFMMNDATVLTLRKFKINSEANNYAWQPGTGDVPDTLLGYPLLTDPYIPTAAVSTISIVFADFSAYYVRLVNDVRVEWSTEYAWDTDLVSVKAVLRADADAIDDTAFASFKGAAT